MQEHKMKTIIAPVFFLVIPVICGDYFRAIPLPKILRNQT